MPKNCVFEHLMQQFIEFFDLATTPPSHICDFVEPHVTLHPPHLEQLATEFANTPLEEDLVDILLEDTLAQWMNEVNQNERSSTKRLKKGAPSRKTPVFQSRG